ncbi:Uncharacterized protein Rs2_41092 [Raphanus sativus]|nr:Uncharacterized protein Rs2_41092 [Raphanus sativus]
MNAPVGPPDDDEAFFMQVEAIEACYKRNSQSGSMVVTSKDQDKSGEPLEEGSGANTERCEQEKGNFCGDDIPVDNGENKEGNVKEGCRVNTVSDNLLHQICSEEDTRRVCLENMAVDSGNHREDNKVASTGDREVDAGDNMQEVSAEDEGDDTDYDYNVWHDYVLKNCVQTTMTIGDAGIIWRKSRRSYGHVHISKGRDLT